MFRPTTIDSLRNKGLSAESTDQDLKKAFYAAAGSPLSADKLPKLREALNGDTSLVSAAEPTTEAKAAKAPKAKKEKAVKAEKPAKEPKAPVAAQTPAEALAARKADPATSARWARVTEVLEMGKRGPTRVRIVCDDKGPNGEDLFRDIAVQDLFQVRYSAGFAKKAARSNRAKSKATAAAEAVPQA